MNINHFHQCQVTFNMGNTAAPEKPQPALPWRGHISKSFLKMSIDFVLVSFDYEQEQLELLK